MSSFGLAYGFLGPSIPFAVLSLLALCPRFFLKILESFLDYPPKGFKSFTDPSLLLETGFSCSKRTPRPFLTFFVIFEFIGFVEPPLFLSPLIFNVEIFSKRTIAILKEQKLLMNGKSLTPIANYKLTPPA